MIPLHKTDNADMLDIQQIRGGMIKEYLIFDRSLVIRMHEKIEEIIKTTPYFFLERFAYTYINDSIDELMNAQAIVDIFLVAIGREHLIELESPRPMGHLAFGFRLIVEIGTRLICQRQSFTSLHTTNNNNTILDNFTRSSK